MTKLKISQTRRGRLFPELQWSDEKKRQWQEEREALRQRCEVIFRQLQPQLLETHYNWYLSIEPESGDSLIHQDDNEAVWLMSQKYPDTPVYLFQINETGVSGQI